MLLKTQTWMLMFLTLTSTLSPGNSQSIDGCPMYGCRPSGAFSFSFGVPRSNVSIGWVADYFIGPIPEAMGCVGNSAALVCQSNGPGPSDTGLMSLDLTTGRVKWRDPVLRFPVLPVMDVDGNIWASDGSNLMHYGINGKLLSPQIQLEPPMHPLLGLQYIAENDLLLLVSATGQISTRTSDGTPMAEKYLTGTVERVNGTFLPVAPAVVNGNRFYVLTEFAPDDSMQTANLGLQRLYAIDTFVRMTDRLEVAWYANFERESNQNDFTGRLKYRPRSWRKKLQRKLNKSNLPKPSIIWDNFVKTLYVSLPPPMLRKNLNLPNTVEWLIGVQDLGNDSALVFRSPRSAVNMVLYEQNMDSNAGDQLWVSVTDGKLLAIGRDGNVSKAIDLEAILKAKFKITSKISCTRAREVDEDFLIFGIEIVEPTEEFGEIIKKYGIDTSLADPSKFVIGVDTPENEGSSKFDQGLLSWMVATPDDTVVNGQIIGIKSNEVSEKDKLVAFSQVDEKFGKYFTIV